MKILVENDEDIVPVLGPIVNSKTISEFERACISIQPAPGCVNPYVVVPDAEFPPETEEILALREEIENLFATIDDMIEEAERLEKEELFTERDALLVKIHQLGEEVDEMLSQLKVALAVHYDNVNALYEQPREIAQSSPEYWAAHLVGGFFGPTDVTGTVYGITMKSTVYVFVFSIIERLSNENNGNQNIILAKLPGVIAFVTMHELGHAFGLSHYKDKNINDRIMMTDKSMSYYQEVNQVFTDDDIKKLQQCQYPH